MQGGRTLYMQVITMQGGHTLYMQVITMQGCRTLYLQGAVGDRIIIYVGNYYTYIHTYILYWVPQSGFSTLIYMEW